jgi:hypothetical protein
LNFLDGMTGRVALASGVSDLATLAGQAKRVGLGHAHAHHQLRLTDESRGKIQIGESTILFQFVAPPPVQSQPRLPLAVKTSLIVDWNLTVIAAFSFLVHFGAIGALYSDWTDPVVDTGADVRGLVDMLPAAPPMTVEDQAPPEDTKTADVTKKDATDKPAPAKPSTTPTTAPKPSVNDHDAHLLAQRAEAIGIGILASFEGKSAVEGALTRGVLPTVDMTKAAESDAAVDNRASELHMTSSGLVAAGKKGLGDVAGGVGTGAKDTAGPVAVVPGPSGKEDLGPIVPSTPVRGLDRTVALLRPKFRRCYESKGLSVDASMAGGVTMVVKIEPNGEVKSADPGAIAGLSQPVVSCIARVLKDASFDAPGSSGSVVQIPVKFVRP